MHPDNPLAPHDTATFHLGDLLTEREAAKVLRVSVSTLQNRRWAGLGPPFLKLGKLVRYIGPRLTEFDTPPHDVADEDTA